MTGRFGMDLADFELGHEHISFKNEKKINRSGVRAGGASSAPPPCPCPPSQVAQAEGREPVLRSAALPCQLGEGHSSGWSRCDRGWAGQGRARGLTPCPPLPGLWGWPPGRTLLSPFLPRPPTSPGVLPSQGASPVLCISPPCFSGCFPPAAWLAAQPALCWAEQGGDPAAA